MRTFTTGDELLLM